ncbi:MAG: 1-phosphofructokinase [Candidatus Omnitrophota bacterium]
MIYTVTINPSIDKHITIAKLIKDDAIRAKSMRRDPGGKGINVSRVVSELKSKTRAFAIIGGCAGYMMRDLLENNKIDFNVIETIGETRINVIITDLSDRTQTRISTEGPKVNSGTIDNFVALLDKADPRPSFWVLGGSLPPGAPKDTYKTIIEHLRKRGEKCALDADGEALHLGIEAVPFMIKPNEYELERLIGKPIGNDNEIAKAATELCDSGIEIVIVSLGKKGAVVATKDQAFKLESPSVEAKSKVGAGDSLIGGLLTALEKGWDIEKAARYGVAAGTAAVLTEGTRLCLREDVERLFGLIKVTTLYKRNKVIVKDIVCGMRIEESQASAKTSFKSARYSFCSLVCKEKFNSDPDKYINRGQNK